MRRRSLPGLWSPRPCTLGCRQVPFLSTSFGVPSPPCLSPRVLPSCSVVESYTHSPRNLTEEIGRSRNINSSIHEEPRASLSRRAKLEAPQSDISRMHDWFVSRREDAVPDFLHCGRRPANISAQLLESGAREGRPGQSEKVSGSPKLALNQSTPGWSHLVVPSGGNAASLHFTWRRGLAEFRDSALRTLVSGSGSEQIAPLFVP